MLNRLFIVTEYIPSPAFRLPSEEGVYCSIRVNPVSPEDLERAYREMGNAATRQYALTLDMRAPLTRDAVRFITSFLFIPAYLRTRQGRVINLLDAEGTGLPVGCRETLSGYFLEQGIRDAVLNEVRLCSGSPEPCLCSDSAEAIVRSYAAVLRSGRPYGNDFFWLAPSGGDSQDIVSSLQQAEADFEKSEPVLYALILHNKQLEEELGLLKKTHEVTAAELNNQKQFVEVLRSGHAARELQDYYNREYEILPLWYKRFGHLVKVMTGKRTFRSLFRDDVKKYTD